MQQFLKLGQEENEIRQVGQAESKGDGTESCTYSGLCTIPTSALKLQHRVMVFFLSEVHFLQLCNIFLFVLTILSRIW